MRQNRGLEIGTGLFILLGLGALFFLATQTTDLRALENGGGYKVSATFTNVGGLKSGAPVSMSGVTIGRVTKITLDPKSLQAVVTMRIRDRYNEIPTDSSASILTHGLLGDQYVGITPGGAETNLKNGSQIHFTQSALILEHLIGQFLFKEASHSGNSSSKSGGKP